PTIDGGSSSRRRRRRRRGRRGAVAETVAGAPRPSSDAPQNAGEPSGAGELADEGFDAGDTEFPDEFDAGPGSADEPPDDAQ
ncbi:MAG: hypothetical protein ACRD2N_18790, partial [Vicinamibacterales bacterium]